MYPTKEEILENIPTFSIDPKDITIFQQWKESYFKGWSRKTIEEKRTQLENLIKKLTKNHDKETRILWVQKWSVSINDSNRTMFGGNPSIISALHEIGHVIYGSRELDACTYSTKMFQTVMPKQYEKLIWDGHLLKKQT
jgi:hypothetical protein